MNLIHKLDTHTINQIAAGEVIEDPSSVVKETIENSIDAKATHIIVKIEDSGKRLIEVSDNGIGMSIDDLKMCYKKHNTSKIKNAHDITNVKTMGFRGEGLASVASVSKLTIQSKLEKNDSGYEVSIENSKIINEGICAFPSHGTKVIIKDLFYNMPARKRFLDTQKDTRVSKRIMDLVQRISLSHPYIRFEFFVSGEKIYHTSGDGNLQHIIAKVYNNKLAQNLLYINKEVYGVKVKGYISRPEDCVGNRTKQTFFVNGRYVEMPILSQALRTAYNSFVVSRKHAVCVLFLEVNENQLDINVHPRKIEVRFQHNIFPVIISSVKSELHNNRSALSVNGKDNIGFEVKVENPNLETKIENSEITDVKTLEPFSTLSETVEEDLLSSFESSDENNEQQENIFSITESKVKTLYKEYPSLEAVGQIMNSYIVAKYSNGMILIDQHAAHERVLYEKYMNKFNKNDIDTVQMLIPLSIDLDSSEYVTITHQFDFFKPYGFILEDFGHNTIIVREYPNFIKEKQVENIIKVMIDEFLSNNNKTTLTDIQHDKIIMRSCKNAIKANMYLNQMQMNQLIEDLSKCENEYHCPHGRPTIIHYDRYQIEKMFSRVVV